MNKTIKLISIVAASFAVGAAANASDKALVDTLIKKGYLTQEEAKEVSKGASMASPTGAMHTTGISFGGLIQAQYDFHKGSTRNSSLDGTLTDKRSSAPSLRNLKLAVNAQLSDGWSADLVLANTNSGSNDLIPVASSSVKVDTATINWTAMDEVQLSIGYDAPAFGLENTTATSQTKTLETSAAGRFFDQVLGIGSSNIGVFAKGSFLDGFYYNAAVTRTSGEVDDGSFADAYTNQPAFYARLGYMNTWDQLSYDVGLDGAFVRGNNAKAAQGKDFGIWAAGAYTKLAYQDFALDMNVMGASLRKAKYDGTNAKPWGLMLAPSYKFMDGRYEVVGMYSYFNSGKSSLYENNSILEDSLGVIPSSVIRGLSISKVPFYNNIAGDDTPIAFNAYHQFYLGGNWYILGNDVKITSGYTYTVAKDNSGTRLNDAPITFGNSSGKFKVHHFGVRLQLLF